MSEIPEKLVGAAATAAEKFTRSKDQRPLRILVLSILAAGTVFACYILGAGERIGIHSPVAMADEVKVIRGKIDEHGRQLDKLLKFQIGTQLLASYQIMCERISPAMRAQEQERINDLQADYRAVNGGNNYTPPPCR